VEAKGANKSLAAGTTCEPDWHNQVRNIAISLNDVSLTPQRHIVIATRVNPKGPDRKLRIKAWNNEGPQDSTAFARILPEVVCAHLFGFYAGIGLPAISRGLARSVYRRSKYKQRVNQSWGTRDRSMADEQLSPNHLTERIDVRNRDSAVIVTLSKPLRDLTSALVKLDRQSDATDAIRTADEYLDAWWHDHRERPEPGTVVLPFGVHIGPSE
jgi:hypothetical protein